VHIRECSLSVYFRTEQSGILLRKADISVNQRDVGAPETENVA